MLYIEPLFKLGTYQPGRKRSRFGYADGVALFAFSPLLEDNCNILAKEWGEIMAWVNRKGLPLISRNRNSST